jgi:hypothetical protein
MVRAEDSRRCSGEIVRRWAVRALIAGFASWFSWAVVIQSGDTQAYDAGDWYEFQYPTVQVILTVVSIAVEAFLVALLLQHGAPRYLWRRALPGGVAMVPLSVIAFNTLMSLPPFHAIHLLWLAVVNAMLAGLAAVSGVVHLVQVVASGRR